MTDRQRTCDYKVWSPDIRLTIEEAPRCTIVAEFMYLQEALDYVDQHRGVCRYNDRLMTVVTGPCGFHSVYRNGIRLWGAGDAADPRHGGHGELVSEARPIL